jgi:hypothetical protein
MNVIAEGLIIIAIAFIVIVLVLNLLKIFEGNE